MRFPAFRFFGILFTLVFFLFFAQIQAHAQSAYTLPDTDPNVPNTLHNYTQNVFLEVFSAIGCQLAGIDLASPREKCLGLNPQTGRIGYVQSGGLIGLTSNMIAVLYTPPAHLTDYTKDLSSNFGLVKQTYAQGVGFTGISPLISIWKIFRNIVYLFFVIIFVVIGFAIMLRFKIDPRTVMSVENQLPKLIVGLLLVTFSFAIAGFLIDLMWVLTFLIINILTPQINLYNSNVTTPLTVPQVTSNVFQNPFGFINNILPGGILGAAFGAGGSAGDVVRSLLTPDNSNRLGLTPSYTQDCENSTPFFGFFGTAACNFGQQVGTWVSGAIGFIVAWIISIVASVVVLIAILIAMFRVWFTLLLAYMYILLDVVIGPFFIMLGLIPGSKVNFSAWIRDLLANLVSFPTIIGLFLLGRLFMEAFVPSGVANTQSLFVPPLIGNPVGGEGQTNPLGWLLGLAIILIAPSIVATMKSLFKVENKLGGQIGQQLAGGFGTLISAGKNVGRTYVASNEYIAGEGGKFKKRTVGQSILGGIFGR